MPRTNHTRNSFLAGEVADGVKGRTDLPQYAHSFSELKNTIVMPQGGSTRRTGSRYVKETNGNGKARIIPFIYANDEAYVVEITSNKIYVINNNTLASTEVTQGLGGPFTFSDTYLDEVQFAQSADILYLVHRSRPPLAIVRTSPNTFTVKLYIREITDVTNLDPWVSQPFRTQNSNPDYEFSPSATSGTVTISSTEDYFVLGMVGSDYKLNQVVGGDRYTGVFRITAFLDPKNVTADVLLDFQDTSGSTDWEEAAWSDYRGYPGTVCFYENRLLYGGNTSQPDTIWGSFDSSFYAMDARGISAGAAGFPAQTNATAFAVTLASTQVNNIQWMSPGKTLAVGTLGAEAILKGPDETLSFGPQNLSAKFETFHGSCKAMALRVAYVVIFIQRSKSRMRELQFDFNSDSYVATNIGQLAKHLTPRMKELAYQEFPNGVIWGLNSIGQLRACTRDQQQQITAWHKHELGGDYAGGVPTIDSICVVPTTGTEDSSTAGSRDRLWMVVNRTINGSAKRYLEFLAEEVDQDSYFPTRSTFYQDCAMYKQLGGGQVSHTVWTGFSHLAGETVAVFGNLDNGSSAYLGDIAVTSGGDITTPQSCTAIIAGYRYETRIQPTRMEGGSTLGSAIGAVKRGDKATIRLERTGWMSFGTNDANLKDVQFRDFTLAETAPWPLFTGDKIVEVPDGYDNDGQLLIVNSTIYPMTVTCIAERFVVNDV